MGCGRSVQITANHLRPGRHQGDELRLDWVLLLLRGVESVEEFEGFAFERLQLERRRHGHIVETPAAIMNKEVLE